MIEIKGVLIHDDIAKEAFACNLEACKGACCWEGEFGAPLLEEEREKLNILLEKILPFLSKESQEVLLSEGVATWNEEPAEYGTALMPDGACAFMTRTKEGVACCGIEQAYRAGEIDFLKPISCHLYPIRVSHNKRHNFLALNYDRWDICSAACTRGNREKIKVYEFAREALIRRFGEAFYEDLAAAASYLAGQRDT